ncbi:methylmalonyl-CoA mutase family protein [Streptomyces yaizuensis]|uniref:methylmalonyl-CoA mutase n=1 Tax=Streptomyces yaizuensis TaxID=2989713 RepID=A0ABQ5P399_9ACTN|nr:methylmalonyl-CoA mutase family protein [Streptomyces sp. YSPA8]GLF97050.1 methylmalonyl-CoA mutase subunit beta [Streptomyces sp. YSPA8]
MTVLPDGGFALAAEFPETSPEAWRQLVAGVLRRSGREVGADDAEAALATALEDGITALPLYTAANGGDAVTGYPGFAPFTRGGRPEGGAVQGWDVRQRHDRPDPARANEAVLTDLENGVTSLWLTAGAAGLPVSALARAVDGVLLDLAPVVLDAGAEFEEAGRAWLRILDEREVTGARGNLGADPLGHAARSGAYDTVEGAVRAAVDLARLCDRDRPGLRALTVDALPYHEAGATPAQELGCSLATGVALLRALTDAGLPVPAALGQLEFRYAATADQFLTIAKLRAARRVWARVAEACGAPAAGAQLQHAVTSPVMMARRDPWVNMLRTTVASLAAGVGGADAVTVLPFDHAAGLPDDFARRIARNTSTVLIEEAHVGRVVDPAGGSWYVERLTEELAQAAWAWFQEIERAGGQLAALRRGLVAERVGAAWERRAGKLARRREPVTGVSEFPLLTEAVLERDPAPEPVSGGLPRVRRDAAFEALRARSDAHLAATGARPRVFLAALGPASEHTARVAFAANLFQAGGIEPVHEPVSVDADSVAEAFAASGAELACVCSSDALYADLAAPVAAALKGAGARRVHLAGRPPKKPWAAVDAYVFAGGDAVGVLTSALDLIGVTR